MIILHEIIEAADADDSVELLCILLRYFMNTGIPIPVDIQAKVLSDYGIDCSLITQNKD